MEQKQTGYKVLCDFSFFSFFFFALFPLFLRYVLSIVHFLFVACFSRFFSGDLMTVTFENVKKLEETNDKKWKNNHI